MLCSCYGDLQVVKVNKGNTAIYHTVKSPVVVPLMQDRMRGKDAFEDAGRVKNPRPKGRDS